MKYRVDDIECDVIIVRKNNKNTYIRVKEDLKIYITTSYFVTNKYIKKLLDENYSYLQKTLSKMKEENEKSNFFYYLGKKYDIIIIPSEKVEILSNYIYVSSIDALEKWKIQQAKILFQDRINHWYSKFEEEIPAPKLKVRKMKTRWGVCNRRNNSVTLNLELLKYSIEKTDYVVVHELSHFVHFNHSKDFWNLVFKYYPNYKTIRKEMKK